MTNKFRQVAQLSLPVGYIFIVIASILVLYSWEILELKEHKEIQQNKIAATLISIDHEITNIINDLNTLSRLSYIQDYWDTDTELNSDLPLVHDLMTTVMQSKAYDQLRIIDSTGMELLRINYKNGLAELVPKQKLQNKKNRYYFSEAIQLNDQEIYISPFDLNLEQDSIELPLKPMIRFATPLYDDEKNKRGIFVLNYLGEKILNEVDLLRFVGENNLMLVNSDSYWLKADTPAREWGFMYPDKKDSTFSNSYPEAWKKIKAQEEGQFETAQGLFTFKTIFPVPGAYQSMNDLEEPYHWKIISYVPSAVIYHPINTRRLYLGIFLFLLLIPFFLIWRRIVTVLKLKEKADKRLAKKEQRYRALFNSNPVSLWEEDLSGVMKLFKKKRAEGVTDLRQYVADHPEFIGECINSIQILDVNPTSLKMLGASDKHDLRQNFLNKFNGKSFQTFTDMLIAIFNGEEIYVGETELVKSDGSIIYAIAQLKLFDNKRKALFTITDINDLKKAKEKNKEIRQRFERISRHIPGVIYQFRKRPDGTFQFPYASPGIYDIYGVNPKEVKHDATAVFSVLHPDDLEQVKASITHSAQTLTPWHEIYRVNHPSGKTIWVEGNSTPVKLDDGSIIWYGYIQDVTRRVKAGVELVESEEKFRALYDNAPLSYQSLDEEGDFLDINPMWLSTLGYERDEVIGKCFKDFLHPDYKPHFEKNFPAFKERGYVHNIHFKIRHKKGHYLDISFEGCVGYKSDGSFKQTYCVFQDITKRVRAEESLRKIEAKHRKLIAKISDVITIIDEKGIIRYKSPNIEKTFGWKPEELVGLSAWENIHPDDLERGKSFFSNLLNKPNETETIEIRYKRKNGDYCYIEFTAVNLLNDPDIKGILGDYQDISERKKHERDLIEAKNTAEENEIRYRALHNASFGGIAIHDKGIILDCNQGLSDITGYSEEELIGMNGLLLISEKTRDMVKENIAAGYEKPYEAIGIRKNGEEYPLHLEARNIPYGGKQVRVVEFRDITERKVAEEELKQTSHILSNSQEIAHFGSWKLDLIANKLEWSDETYRIMGLDPNGPPPEYNEMLEKSIHPDDAKLLDESFKAAMREQGVYELEHRIVRPDGSVRWAFEKGNPYFDKDDNLLGYYGATLDITERKKAEQQLMLYIRALEASSVSVVITDADGAVEYVNPYFTEITGYTLEEVRGENPRILKSGTQNEAFYEDLWNTLKSGKDWSGEFQNKKKNGELFWESAVISPIKSAATGQITHFVAIKEDITELLEKEGQLKQSLKEKEVLLAEIHHRVKNNLAVVSGMMQLQSFDEENPDVQEKLSDSISRIKTIAKIHEKLYQNETFSSIDLSENIRELTHENVNSLSAGKAIEVEFSLERVQLNMNEAVPCSLIVNEVLVNALKHAFINKETGNISVHLSEQENQVEVTITDNGIGFPEDFTPKNQSSGMIIIQVLTEQLEGEHRYERIKTGTEFTLTFEKTAIKGSLSASLF